LKKRVAAASVNPWRALATAASPCSVLFQGLEQYMQIIPLDSMTGRWHFLVHELAHALLTPVFLAVRRLRRRDE
jgi:hypothetical protein